MYNTQVHLILNHIPVLGVIFGILLWMSALGMENIKIKKIVCIWFILIAISAIIVSITGEASEDFIEKLPGVSESIMKTHEETAEIAMIFTLILGLLAMIGSYFLFRNIKMPSILWVGILILAIATFIVMSWTANTGGKIRHTELSMNAQSVIDLQKQNNEGEGEHDKD